MHMRPLAAKIFQPDTYPPNLPKSHFLVHRYSHRGTAQIAGYAFVVGAGETDIYELCAETETAVGGGSGEF
jgi:hypothetical protein